MTDAFPREGRRFARPLPSRIENLGIPWFPNTLSLLYPLYPPSPSLFSFSPRVDELQRRAGKTVSIFAVDNSNSLLEKKKKKKKESQFLVGQRSVDNFDKDGRGTRSKK